MYPARTCTLPRNPTNSRDQKREQAPCHHQPAGGRLAHIIIKMSEPICPLYQKRHVNDLTTYPHSQGPLERGAHLTAPTSTSLGPNSSNQSREQTNHGRRPRGGKLAHIIIKMSEPICPLYQKRHVNERGARCGRGGSARNCARNVVENGAAAVREIVREIVREMSSKMARRRRAKCRRKCGGVTTRKWWARNVIKNVARRRHFSSRLGTNVVAKNAPQFLEQMSSMHDIILLFHMSRCPKGYRACAESYVVNLSPPRIHFAKCIRGGAKPTTKYRTYAGHTRHMK